MSERNENDRKPWILFDTTKVKRLNTPQERVDFAFNLQKDEPAPKYTKADFDNMQEKFEGFIETCKNVKDEDGKNATPTVGYGNTTYTDPNSGQTRKVVLGEKWTREQAIEQKDIELNKRLKILQEKCPNFDKYPAGMRYAMLDAIYNLKLNSFIDKSPKFWNRVSEYDKRGNYNDLFNRKRVADEMDWSRKGTGNLPLRSRVRQLMAIDAYDPADNKWLDNIERRDKLIEKYDSIFNRYASPALPHTLRELNAQ